MATLASRPPVFAVVRSADRAHADHGWLDTYYSFSFADYVDPANVRWGALRVFNDDTIAPGSGFPTHPHRDMEIVTYVLSGELAHRDSLGNHGVVGPGGVQFMSAGTGVAHSEVNDSREHPLHLVQMWVLPGQLGGEPSYGQMDFSVDQRRNRWLEVVSGEPGVDAPVRITQRATLRVARVEGTSIVAEFAPQRYGFLFVADGTVEVNGEALQAGDSVRVYDVARLAVGGRGEVVLWDTPEVEP
ncbi:MAG TPA: pirin family protein [Candidatus Dormibacteraeota bacterium]|nr:pirin family protein [Candidatus Dormibacteraeota bacterium]